MLQFIAWHLFIHQNYLFIHQSGEGTVRVTQGSKTLGPAIAPKFPDLVARKSISISGKHGKLVASQKNLVAMLSFVKFAKSGASGLAMRQQHLTSTTLNLMHQFDNIS